MLLVGSPLVNFVPPSELRAFRPACFPPGLESRPGVHRNLSPEVCSPSSARVQSVHHSRPCLSRCVPPAPFLTTSAACSAPHRPRISLGGTHGVSLPTGLLPSCAGRLRLRLRQPLLTLPRRLRAFAGVRPSKRPSACCLSVPSGYPCTSTVSVRLQFPFGRGPTPSWVSLQDLASHHPKATLRVRSSSRSDLSMSRFEYFTW